MKNVLILNNRALDYYDFQELKLKHPLKIFCVVTENYYQKLSQKTKNDVDHFFILPAQSLLEPIPFPIEDVREIIRDNFDVKEGTFFIHSGEESNLILAAQLRQEYSLPGTSSETLEKFKRKAYQKAILQSQRICVPRNYLLSYDDLKNQHLYNFLVNRLGLPFILKPNDLVGTINVRKVKSKNDFTTYLSQLNPPNNPNAFFCAEEFINGQLYHCDLIMQKNRTYFAQSSQYFFGGLSFINGKIHGSIPLRVNHPLNSRLIEVAEKATEILGLENGCSHHEMFVQPNGEIIYLESGARPAGSLVPIIYNNCFNINLMNCALALDCNLQLPSVNKEPQTYQFWAMFPLLTGIVTNINIPSIKSKVELEVYVELQSTIFKSTSVSQKAATLIAKNSHYEDLYKDFMDLRKHSFLTVKA